MKLQNKERAWLAKVTLALVVLSSVPYLIAWMGTPEGTHFTGLLFNPQDGNSYLAKMRQGAEGSWRFHLAFTPERHRGAYLFLFHLLLGHLARWSGLPLILVYHAARLMGGAAMLFSIYSLAAELTDSVRERRAMFLLAALGSGLGWLMGGLGVETADLWVPEAFPIYSLMGNAHFPLAIALMATIASRGLRIAKSGDEIADRSPSLTLDESPATERGLSSAQSVHKEEPSHLPRAHWGPPELQTAGLIAAAVALGAIQPFGLVPAFGGLGVMLAARTARKRAIPWRIGAWIAGAAALALPYPLYMQHAIQSDPVLAAWNAQNVTLSPPLWDWALSYGLVLALAVLGAVAAARRGADGDAALVGWALVTLVGMYLPLPLQRRLSLGLGVPLGLLAGMGWWRAIRPKIGAGRRRLVQGTVVAFSALTPVFLAMMAAGASIGSPWFYLSDGEWAALTWLRSEGRPDKVVLCSPQMGGFVPAWAGQPVVYGHPFETVNAEQRKARVQAYWSGELSPSERETLLQDNRVGYILVGPRERAPGAAGQTSVEQGVAFAADGAKVYKLKCTK